MDIQCKYCGTSNEIEKIEYDTDYYCPVCSSLVYRKGQPFQFVFFITITSLILFLWTLNQPLLAIKIAGIEHSTSILFAVGNLIENERYIAAVILGLSVVIIPLIMIILMVTIMVSVRLKAVSPQTLRFVKYYKVVKEWNMSEVYLVGVFIAIIKLRNMADITIEFGTLLFLMFLITFYIAVEWFNPDDLFVFCSNLQCTNAEKLLFLKEWQSE